MFMLWMNIKLYLSSLKGIQTYTSTHTYAFENGNILFSNDSSYCCLCDNTIMFRQKGFFLCVMLRKYQSPLIAICSEKPVGEKCR